MPRAPYIEPTEPPRLFPDWDSMKAHVFSNFVDGGKGGTRQVNEDWKWAKLRAPPTPVAILPNRATLWCRLTVLVEDPNFEEHSVDLSNDARAFYSALKKVGRHWSTRTSAEVHSLEPSARNQALARITYGGVVWFFADIKKYPCVFIRQSLFGPLRQTT
jgi:hypothetical protein